MNNEEYFSDFDENDDIDSYSDPEELDLDDEDLDTIAEGDEEEETEEEKGEEY